uniref:Uncharacterized protein n=1 Tax=Arundo donax TaxID=35708 RepID=A0A0A9ELS3_ARUDO
MGAQKATPGEEAVVGLPIHNCCFSVTCEVSTSNILSLLEPQIITCLIHLHVVLADTISRVFCCCS